MNRSELLECGRGLRASCSPSVRRAGHGLTVDYQRTDKVCKQQNSTAEKLPRRGERIDDRALLDRGILRTWPKYGVERAGGDIHFGNKDGLLLALLARDAAAEVAENLDVSWRSRSRRPRNSLCMSQASSAPITSFPTWTS